MSVAEIIKKLRENNIELSVDDGNLRVRGSKLALGDPELLELVRQNKNELMATIASGGYLGAAKGLVAVPPNLIPAGCTAITPEMLPLVKLSQAEIGKITGWVPGGAGNVQDIYPLAPLQEGILFHHMLDKEGDIYLVPSLISFDSRERLERYVEALQAVMNRHDSLKSSFVWEGLPEPVQVVWRHAPLVVEEVDLDPSAGDISLQLRAMFDPRHYRVDLHQAPLWRLYIAEDAPNRRWLLLQLVHHLISDLTSVDVLNQEIELYLLGHADRLPPSIPFRTFVAQARHGISKEEHEIFFTRMLGDVDEPTAPFGLMDVQRDGTRTVEAHQEVGPTLCRRLRALTRAMGVSAASVCHLAWSQVLARLSGRDDVVFGMMVLGRMHGGAGVDRALGLFINALPFRTKLGDGGAEASIRESHELLVQLMRHEHAPLALVQRCSAVRAPAPLFTAMMNYRYGDDHGAAESPRSAEAWKGIEFFWSQERINYPLGLAVNDRGEQLTVDVQADDSIDAAQVCTLVLTALESLVTAAEQASTTPVRKLEVLPPSMRSDLLALGNGGSSVESIPGLLHGCLFDLVAAQAKCRPDAVAIVEPGSDLTYRQLVERANGVAQCLIQWGVGPETCVALLADRSSESLVGMLGILAAGAAYVPLDPLSPTERLAFVVDNASALALLAPAALQEQANLVAAHSSKVAEHVLVIAHAPASDAVAVSNVSADNAAYVIYTSGTTGTPKGVVVNHRSAMNLVHAFVAHHDFGNQRLLMIPPLMFDASVGDVFPVLAVGSTLVLHPAPTELGAAELQDFCREYGVTAIDAPAALWRRWTEAFATSPGPERVLPSLRLMMFGGESVQLEQVRRFAQLTENRVALSNHYGPTEAAVCATMLTTYDGAEFSSAELPIGKPLPGVQVYVLDRDLQLLPRGVEGELYIGGVGVARGYLGESELTESRFFRDPFSKGQDARMYRTGDIVRWNADGTLQFLGRRDHQVKIRGFRIELGEIEARLSEHVGVLEAVVLAREDAPGDKRLVAYLTTQAGEPLDIPALRTHLAKVLPEYMVPAAYVPMESFPLTANGKLDRKALPAPESDAYVTREYVAPAGEVESTLARIWAEVLKLERVGRHDNFFALGGHSLLAVTLIERMRRAGLQIDVRSLFAAPTLIELAALVGGEDRTVTVPPNLVPPGCEDITPAMLPLVQLSQADIGKIVASVPGGAGNVQDIYPLAPLQEGLLFHHLLKKEGDVYLSSTLFAADSRERLDRYAAALQAVIDRHDILRTSVFWKDLPEPVQVVWRHAPLVVEEVIFDPAAGDVAAQMQARFDPRHFRIDVRQAPLWRLFIAEDAPNHRWVLLELMHHLAGDHVTLQAIEEEIRAILQGHAEQLPTPLPFRNFVAQARLGVSRSEHEAFFTQMLGDVEEPTTPFGLTDAQGDGSQIVEASHAIDPELCRRLRVQAGALGVTAASICHLTWALVLARASGRDDVVFGTVMFGRMQGGEGADRVMGIFINTLPLRIKLGNESVRASVRQTHELLTQLLKHEHAPLSLAQRCSAVQAPAPLFTSLLNYRHVRAEAWNAEKGIDAAQTWAGMQFLGSQERTNYPFGLAVNDLGQGLVLDVQVDGSIDAQRVWTMMHTALESLVMALERDPKIPVCHLNVVPPAERHRLLSEWNATEADYSKSVCIHQLFEAQVAREPQAVAVSDESRQLTYGELNAKANRLARHLVALGVGPDQLVAICLDRSVDLLVGMLGVLKAGGAYIPMDSSNPQQRLKDIFEDAQPRVLLTQRHLRAVLPQCDARVIELDEGWDQPAENSSNLDPQALGLRPSNLAYVIFTSGSTGRPKGVMVEHGSVVNFLYSMRVEPGIGREDRLLALTTVSFDIAALELFLPLLAGAEVILAGSHIVADALLIDQMLQRRDVTMLQGTPATWRLLVENKDWRAPGLRALCGGEALPASLASQVLSRVDALWNLYGPTETTIYSTMQRITGSSASTAAEPIGSPIANTRIYVLDARRELAPIGVTGEIYIGGDGVARGYFGKAELTQERFLQDPFSTVPGGRMYRTGDLGRWRPDGTIEYLGRNDFQVKIRGFRIELGEIEARLAEHPGVRQAVVLAREDRPGDNRLVAYVTAREISENGAVEDQLDVEGLRAHLSALLPEYMVPAAYVKLAKLPLTPNGKLDRKALPAPDGGAYVTREYRAPVGEVETTVARVWAEVLNLERVGRNDNFFEIGGHSLLVFKVTSLLQQSGIAATVADLFNHSTVESLATALANAPAAAPVRGALRIREGSETPLFLVHDGYGDELYFSALAQHLPRELPVYGLPGAYANEAPLHTMRAMAERMVHLLQQVQPAGPYRLAGWSFGGVLAYEIAQLLLDRGHALEFLGLMDAFCPDIDERADDRERPPEAVLIELCEEQRAERSYPSSATAEFDVADPHLDFDAVFNRYRELQALPEKFNHLSAPEALAQCRNLEINSRAMAAYRPRPIDIPVHLFAAGERPPGWTGATAQLGWERCVPAHLLCAQTVPGSHFSMMTAPHIKVLGQRLAESLTAAVNMKVCP